MDLVFCCSVLWMQGRLMSSVMPEAKGLHAGNSLRRTRTCLKCLFAVLVALIALVFIASIRWVYRWDSGPHNPRAVMVTRGAVIVSARPAVAPYGVRQTTRWIFARCHTAPTWHILWRPVWNQSALVSHYVFPLWIPLVVLVVLLTRRKVQLWTPPSPAVSEK